MTKTYTFHDDGWWDSNGCDCCEDWFFEAYNSEDVDPSLGTAHSYEDCVAYALITEAGGVDAFFDAELDRIWEMDWAELVDNANDLGIVVEVVNEKGKEVLTNAAFMLK